jgi:hypothetical protein
MSATHFRSSKWTTWRATDEIISNSASSERTKPTERGFDGFVASIPRHFPKIETGDLERSRAFEFLNRAGVRMVRSAGIATVGIWSDLDSQQIREALCIVGLGESQVRYLDGAGIPTRYKLRRVKGDPAPMSVLGEMEKHSVEPWTVQNRM